MKIYSIGHSNRSSGELVEMLKAHGIGCLVDIRSKPDSARFAQFNRSTLEWALIQAGIQYRWEGESLGGRRTATPDDSKHKVLASEFRAYAAYMETPHFREAVEQILRQARSCRTALMCAEKDPSRCHRFLISDYLTVRGHSVEHLIVPNESCRHDLHSAARIVGSRLVYDRALENLELFARDAN
ncbi:DUF488 domain-containing protein [Methylocaldum sp.]|uniref:DUF488 domain-containing protein n=1 Tax=Methylocaldum sp. TaxID=1969727 RepID=UPI002D604B61|nr:DUF488 domain-containing protein [Methylocaldum sp.]HYE34561.1 DUF488 domain-containing protein [Methylocaldum sp.]